MSSVRIINEISLANWFNYKGGFDENKIDFKKGLNIVVGDNNAGKSKLHNAFRWILCDEIVLEQKDGPAINTKINESNFREILNQTYFNSLNDRDAIEFGVKLTFTHERSVDSSKITYVLSKKVLCRRDSSSVLGFTDFKIEKKVFNKNLLTGQIRTSSEDFEIISTKLISPIYQNFFLIEGEQLGLMTPLEGEKLKKTVNNLVNIQDLDNSVYRSERLKSYAEGAKDKMESEEETLSEKRRIALEHIASLKQENEDLKKDLIEWAQVKDKNQKLIEMYKDLAENSHTKKQKVKEYEALVKNIEIKTADRDREIINFLKSIIGLPVFGISKLTDDTDQISKINEQISLIDTMISQRRTELNSRLSEKEQKMIMSLEKSQPKPQILREMVLVGDCYVCNSRLNDDSKRFIEQILIPFFEGEMEEDEELDKLNEVKDLLRDIKLELDGYIKDDFEMFELFDKKIEEAAGELLDAEASKMGYIDMNGIPEDEETDEINIITFAQAVKDEGEANKELIRIKSDISDNSIKIGRLEQESKDPEREESEEFKKMKNLSNFLTELNSTLVKLKNDKYDEFVQELQIKSTNRYQQFMKHNATSQKQKIEVKKFEGAGGNIEFSINVIDERGNISKQGGGADQAIRRVSVVFGLLDYAENKNGFPFIADAPVSKLSPDTKLAFFETIANDKALNQSIIMTMDLWSSKNNSLNELGENVKALISNKQDTGFKLLKPIEVNKGVNIETII